MYFMIFDSQNTSAFVEEIARMGQQPSLKVILLKSVSGIALIVNQGCLTGKSESL